MKKVRSIHHLPSENYAANKTKVKKEQFRRFGAALFIIGRLTQRRRFYYQTP